jgi:hypothetical protein
MTLEDVTKRKPRLSAEQLAAEELVRQAREQGLALDRLGRTAEVADQNGPG